MSDRRLLLYFAWSRPGETGAPLGIIDDRFPAIFELRRLFYPKFENLADPHDVDPGIAGFLDHVQRPNFQAFATCAETVSGNAAVQAERENDNAEQTPLDAALIADADTIVVISFDSLRTGQAASQAEIAAVEAFLANPDHVILVCPHHDIGEAEGTSGGETDELRIAEHSHHGDAGIPPRQGFGGSPEPCSPDWACRSRTASACAPPRPRKGRRRPSTSIAHATR